MQGENREGLAEDGHRGAGKQRRSKETPGSGIIPTDSLVYQAASADVKKK